MTSIPFFVSLIPIIILHVLNILRLRKGLSQSNVHVSKTMSMILAAIIIIFVVANTPAIILNFLYLYAIQSQLFLFGQHFLMLSNCSNPFVYVFYSKTTRTVVSNVFTCKYFRNKTWCEFVKILRLVPTLVTSSLK